jgi:hypothetical protein
MKCQAAIRGSRSRRATPLSWEQRMGCFQAADETLAPHDHERFKKEAFTLLQTLRHGDGIRESRSAVFAVAHPAGTAGVRV